MSDPCIHREDHLQLAPARNSRRGNREYGPTAQSEASAAEFPDAQLRALR